MLCARGETFPAWFVIWTCASRKKDTVDRVLAPVVKVSFGIGDAPAQRGNRGQNGVVPDWRCLSLYSLREHLFGWCHFTKKDLVEGDMSSCGWTEDMI